MILKIQWVDLAWFVPPMVTMIMLAYLISVMEQDPLIRIGLYGAIIGNVFVIIWLIYAFSKRGGEAGA